MGPPSVHTFQLFVTKIYSSGLVNVESYILRFCFCYFSQIVNSFVTNFINTIMEFQVISYQLLILHPQLQNSLKIVANPRISYVQVSPVAFVSCQHRKDTSLDFLFFLPFFSFLKSPLMAKETLSFFYGIVTLLTWWIVMDMECGVSEVSPVWDLVTGRLGLRDLRSIYVILRFGR